MKPKRKASTGIPWPVKQEFPQVTKVRDSATPIKITVRASDEQRGHKLDASSCALARACRRQEKADGVIIRLRKAYIIKGNTAVRYCTTESIRREIVSFDRHGNFAPGVYVLSAVPQTQRLGVRPGRPRGSNNKNGKHSKFAVHRHVTTGVR